MQHCALRQLSSALQCRVVAAAAARGGQQVAAPQLPAALANKDIRYVLLHMQPLNVVRPREQSRFTCQNGHKPSLGLAFTLRTTHSVPLMFYNHLCHIPDILAEVFCTKLFPTDTPLIFSMVLFYHTMSCRSECQDTSAICIDATAVLVQAV